MARNPPAAGTLAIPLEEWLRLASTSSDTQNRLIDAKNRKRRTPPRTSTQNSQSISRITHTLGTPSQCFRFRKGRLRRLRLSKSRLRAPSISAFFCRNRSKICVDRAGSKRMPSRPSISAFFCGNGWENLHLEAALHYFGHAPTLLTLIPRVDSLLEDAS